MPTDPATVPPLTNTEAGKYCASKGWQKRVAHWTDVLQAYENGYALAASRVDTAEVERRAKYEALTEARSIAMRPGTWEQVDDRLKARAEKYAPAPAPRECVLSGRSAGCRRSGADRRVAK